MTSPALDTRPAVLGHGLLADTIRRVLPAGPAVVVVAGDSWDTSSYPDVRAACREWEIRWLPVRTELGRVVIGPIGLPRESGCVDCAEGRRRRARAYPQGFDAMWARHGATLARRPAELLTPPAAELVASLVADEVAGAARTRRAMLYVDLPTLRVTTHRFLPDPHCVHCGDLPADDAASARITLRPRPKLGPGTYRVRAVADELDELKRTYVDAECGVVRTIRRDAVAGLAVASAPMGLPGGRVENGYGRTRSYRASETTALLEALERFGGVRPGGKRTTVRASFDDVRDRAVDPRSLGLHSAEQYRLPGFRYRPFDEHAPYRWVWGYSFARAEPILVPESYAYYHTEDPDAFVYEISNGCALGSCLEEAILYGLLEVAERDSFLMTWYARMSVPRVDPASARDPAIPTLVNTIEAETRYRVTIYETTVEQGIPCFWVLAINPSDVDRRPKLLCAAGAHLDPERAVENALSELGPILASLITTFPAKGEAARAMVADPLLVRSMPDHSVVNGDAAAFDRFAFLTGPGPVRSFAEVAWPGDADHDDLSDDLRATVDRYLGTGLDVIVVDQTTPEHRAGGLSCAKVIVPGTLPMTFGHRFRRVEGFPRLTEVPRLLGHRPGEINPHPHPFP